MSTTMQIAVGGKSVGFIDREGSSPSIPTQVRSRTTDPFYPIPLVLIHSHFFILSLTSLFYLFMKRRNENRNLSIL